MLNVFLRQQKRQNSFIPLSIALQPAGGLAIWRGNEYMLNFLFAIRLQFRPTNNTGRNHPSIHLKLLKFCPADGTALKKFIVLVDVQFFPKVSVFFNTIYYIEKNEKSIKTMPQIREIKNLNMDERIELWNDLWFSIIRDADIPLSDKEKQVLDKRYKTFQNNPHRGKPWSEIYKNLGSITNLVE